MGSIVNTAFQQWQIAAVNTNTITSLQLAGIQQVNFVESVGNLTPQQRIETDIARLTNGPGFQQLRNDFAADIVILITNGNYGNYRGIVSEIGPLEPNAFGIVQLTTATSNFTFIHEVGHLMGAMHNNDPTPGDAHGHEWQTGVWPFQNKYQSIMSVLKNGTERVLHFSNPLVSHQGQPTGVIGTSNNRRVINVNGPIVEAFRFTAPGLWASINGPASAYNGDPLSFIPSIIGGFSPYAYTWYVNTGSGFYFAGNGGYLNINMPTNNNLSIQLVVTDAANGTFTATRIVQNNFFGGGCSICPEVLEKMDFDSLESQILEADIIFPNPTSHIVTAVIQPELNWNKEFEIIDLNNGFVLTKKTEILSIEGNRIELNISKLPKGVYLFQYKIDNLIKSIKFIKN